MIVGSITATTIPEAWETSIMMTWQMGHRYETEYDLPEEKLSKDICLCLNVREPMAEPRIHRGFLGQFSDLEKYRLEILYGIHDHWISPETGKWAYTYHNRLRVFRGDQVQFVVEKLKQAPHSRRALMATWIPSVDQQVDDPPCLQTMWFRVFGGKLDMIITIRSNDAFKAGFYNMYAFTELQAMVAKMLGIPVGRYVHFAHSYHIYGKDFDTFQDFMETTAKRVVFGARTMLTSEAVPFFIDGCEEILKEEFLPVDKHKIVMARLAELKAGEY